MKNLIKNLALIALSMITLYSCSTNDNSTPKLTDEAGKTLERKKVAIPPPPVVTDLVFTNNTSNKTLIVAGIIAVGKVPTGSAAISVDSKGQFKGNGGNLMVQAGQTVRLSNYVTVTTTDNSTGAILPIDNDVKNWNLRYVSSALFVPGSTLNTDVLNTYGFSSSTLPAGIKFSKWDNIIINGLDSTNAYYTTYVGNSTSTLSTYMGVAATGSNTNTLNSSTLLGTLNTSITMSGGVGTMTVSRLISGNSIIVTAQ